MRHSRNSLHRRRSGRSTFEEAFSSGTQGHAANQNHAASGNPDCDRKVFQRREDGDLGGEPLNRNTHRLRPKRDKDKGCER